MDETLKTQARRSCLQVLHQMKRSLRQTRPRGEEAKTPLEEDAEARTRTKTSLWKAAEVMMKVDLDEDAETKMEQAARPSRRSGTLKKKSPPPQRVRVRCERNHGHLS